MLTLSHQKLIVWLDGQLKKQQYGSDTLTIIVKDGIPIAESARLVIMKRRRYKLPTLPTKEGE